MPVKFCFFLRYLVTTVLDTTVLGTRKCKLLFLPGTKVRLLVTTYQLLYKCNLKEFANLNEEIVRRSHLNTISFTLKYLQIKCRIEVLF